MGEVFLGCLATSEEGPLEAFRDFEEKEMCDFVCGTWRGWSLAAVRRAEKIRPGCPVASYDNLFSLSFMSRSTKSFFRRQGDRKGGQAIGKAIGRPPNDTGNGPVSLLVCSL